MGQWRIEDNAHHQDNHHELRLCSNEASPGGQQVRREDGARSWDRVRSVPEGALCVHGSVLWGDADLRGGRGLAAGVEPEATQARLEGGG